MRFVALLALPALTVASLGAGLAAQTAPTTSPTDSATAADTSAQPKKRAPRRRPVTAHDARTAFADARARTLLERARAARIAQDTALRAYDAKTYFRMSVGVGVRRIGRDRLLMRSEQSSRVRWARGSQLFVEPTGRRVAFPMGDADFDMSPAAPVPYFPGRESLWMPSGGNGVVKAEVDENDMLHPLATGAEAYYRYRSGDSVSIRLPDGRVIALRELRITARRPEWRAFVGSFWFDADRGSLVRAAYRMAAEIDIWAEAGEERRRELEEIAARGDTGAVAQAARDRVNDEYGDDVGSRIGRGMFSPMRATLTAVTVEYALHEGRFWLPKLNVAEGAIQAGFLRMPMRWEESFRYESVNGDDVIAAIAALPPLPPEDTLYAGAVSITMSGDGGTPDTTLVERMARTDSAITRYQGKVDSLVRVADSLRAKGDTAGARERLEASQWYQARVRRLTRRREACSRGDSSYYAGSMSRHEGSPRMAVRLPCDESVLASSPDLPGSIHDPDEQLFGASERDALIESLSLGLQPGWGPQRPVIHAGLDLVRYNRIEGLSPGVSVRSTLGLGYTAQLVGRFGIADRVPRGELTLARSNGRDELRLGVFHRLGVANDDWGSPLSLGASLANVLYARDEGFYYRSWGAELSGSRDVAGPLGSTLLWRLFAERHRTAGAEPNTQASLANAIGDTRFERNIEAASLASLGAAGDLARTFGADPRGARLDTRWRMEGAVTDWKAPATRGYGRVAFDGTVAGPLGRLSAGLTGAAGAGVGELPPQRLFHVGGLQTVRGQFARPVGEGRVGDSFWLARAELGLVRGLAFRPTLFHDIGWAGSRADFGTGTPLSGVGAGLSLLDGMVRVDVSKGIRPEQYWRWDLSLEARF